MKFSLSVVALVAVANQVSAQDLSALPSCALGPILAAVSSSGCALTDVACICQSAAFLKAATATVMAVCSPADQLAALQGSTILCAAAGVTLPTPAVSTPTTVGTSTDSSTTTTSATTTDTTTTDSTLTTAVYTPASNATTSYVSPPVFTGAAVVQVANWAAVGLMGGAALLVL